jgi:hypothetical protein
MRARPEYGWLGVHISSGVVSAGTTAQQVVENPEKPEEIEGHL